jgi:ADP-heptose:LPS heptosyltransferase
MGSLPRLCWPVKPNAYLKPASFYPRSSKKRIGIAWFGGTLRTHEELRNARPEAWKEFLDLDADFVSLQYGPREHEAERIGVSHDSDVIGDLDSLAALIKSCDLVISVCNTTIHMAGALGVPCLILTPHAPAWRYGLQGEKMVWYDSPVMIRQKKGESWGSVIQRAKARCADYGIVPRPQFAAA